MKPDTNIVSHNGAEARRVWWAFLLERCNYDLSTDRVAKVAYRMGQLSAQYPEQGWRPLYVARSDAGERAWEYTRTDVARQALCMQFMQAAKNPRDTLVMFDIDHTHPVAMAQQLVAHDVEVVAPLMFRRCEPYQACAFVKGADGDLHHAAGWPRGLIRVEQVGAGCIAIQKRALTKIMDAGLGPYFWKYEYFDDMRMPSEDMYFGRLCREAGVEVWLDTTVETPHMTLGLIDESVHDEYLADHPELRESLVSLEAEAINVSATG